LKYPKQGYIIGVVMAGKEKKTNKQSLHYDITRPADKLVIAWVNAIAAYIRVTPNTIGRLMLMDGCVAFAKQHNIDLPNGTDKKTADQSADAG
jgi:hypothetical protein